MIGLAAFAVSVSVLAPARALNLLEGASVRVTTNASPAAGDWAVSVPLDKPGRYACRLRVEFTVDNLPDARVLSLKKPEYISEWSLNGQPLLGPPADTFYPELEGIPASALKKGGNVLEASFKFTVNLRDGKPHPKSVGDYTLDLQSGNLDRFEIRTGPILGAAGHDYFTVGCRTRMPATVTLHCDGRTWTSAPGVIHRLRAEGLADGKAYDYTLIADLVGGGASATSKTWRVKIPSRQGPWTFVALGDARNNPKIWNRISEEAAAVKPDFAIHTGDIVGNGNQYEAWDFEFAAPAAEFLATIPCFYTFGNHENNVSMLYTLFGFPDDTTRGNLAQRIGPVQLFGLNRFENWGKGSPNLVGLEKELAACDAPFIVAFTHPPAWSSGSHGNDKLGKDEHFPIFDKYGVTALIAGHDHCYERSEPGGTTMLIAGGGGASLYKNTNAKDNPHSKIYRSEYNFLVFRTDGETLDMKALTYGGLKTPDKDRKLEEVDKRTWPARRRSSPKT